MGDATHAGHRDGHGDGHDAVALVTRLLRGCRGWDCDDLSVIAIDGGTTNRNLLVTAGGRRAVARLPGARTELLGIDRANEAEAAARAAALGIGPALLDILPEVGTALAEFVDGYHLTGEPFTARLDDVVAVMRTLHGSGPLSAGFPVHRVVERHARDASAHGIAPPAAYGRLLDASAAIERAMLAASVPLVPCHNDLLPANVLFERARDDGRPPRVLLLDYEYAGMNDPSFDLGNLSVNCGLDEAGDEALLRAYSGRVTASGMARLGLMKVMSEFREGMWAVVQQAISDLDTDFAGYAAERLERCERLAASPPFRRWLHDAAQGPGTT